MESLENPLESSLRFPFSGYLLPNRLVKVAMAECLTVFGGGPPTEGHHRIYRSWARGGWGMIISGNVQIDPDWLATPWDLAVPRSLDPTSSSLAPWISFVDSISQAASDDDDVDDPDCPSAGPLVIQLSHPGRQSPLFARRKPLSSPLAPSPIPISSEGLINSILNTLLFRTPRNDVSDEEIDDVLRRFGQTARFLEEAGVKGVEIHAAHGYLLAQFLSPLSNKRPPSSIFSLQPGLGPDDGDDHVSGNGGGGLEVLRRVLRYVRENTKREFIVGIKMNCGDFVDGGLGEDEAIEQVIDVRQMLVRVCREGKEESKEGWDFVELSGGNYTNPVFASSSGPNIPFQSFSTRLLKIQPSPSLPPLLLSSSLRSVPSLLSALHPAPSPSAHLLGFARPSVAYPSLPKSHLLRKRKEIREFEMPNLDHVYRWSDLFTLSFLTGRLSQRNHAINISTDIDSTSDERTPEVKTKTRKKDSSGLIGAGLGTVWWTFQINRLVNDRPFKPDLGIWEGVLYQFGPSVASIRPSWSRWAFIGLVGFLAWWLGLT
ncbi:NADH:flavin oxidoreductase/12-oxophytodienoate reductase [Phaffia rhodozyma]|uniref:NADH:flavin oxidoreductase/12-oxophytodienoate reductase n=1 Tax=Phaffia rhodozyma TaxID=264483 RepID=A0A0F7SGZ1_PHARH|nr:NADH:flavin oxidoreductase/12-oxophytodienoate reductase [Phaffia rhodozyma]